MSSKNVSSAENQQERLKITGWIVGFVGGEGAFTVSINKSSTSSTGWQVFQKTTKVFRILTDYTPNFKGSNLIK
jgi:hypothetical protein